MNIYHRLDLIDINSIKQPKKEKKMCRQQIDENVFWEECIKKVKFTQQRKEE